MNKRLCIGSFVFTILIGSLLHFTYEFSNYNDIVGIFSSVNESTWEHLKMFFWPFLIFWLATYIFIKNKPCNFFFKLFISLVVGTFTVVSSFYTYSGILGYNILICDILTFVLGTFAATVYMCRKKTGKCNKYLNVIGIALIFLMCAMFAYFTFSAPSLGIFQLPQPK